jgi:uncharacterized protein YjbJ (UPF0337 family)
MMDQRKIVEDGYDAIADRFGEWRAAGAIPTTRRKSFSSPRVSSSSGSRSFRSRSPKAPRASCGFWPRKCGLGRVRLGTRVPLNRKGETVDRDRIEGELKEQEGKLTGDDVREKQGQTQEKWGEAKDKTDDLKDEIDDRI